MNKLFKLFYGFAAMMITALAVSCSSDDLESVGTYDGSTVTVSLNVTAPDALETTRALSGSNSACGGLSNVDLSSGDYVLRYQLKIYEVTTSDDETETLSLIDEQPDAAYVTDASSTSASFTATLTTGSTYKFVVWADFVKATSSSDEGTTTTTYEDLHYDTSDGLTSTGWTITCIDGTGAQLNDESRDAYFACSEQTISSENNSITIECSRPFAKIRLVTTDWEEGKADAVSIQYYSGSRFTNIDLLTGVSESEELSSTSDEYTAYIPEDAYAAGYDAESGKKTIVVDYLMTDITDQSSINFTYTAYLGTTTGKTLDITTPIQRNYLTTVTGALLTTASSGTGTDTGGTDTDETGTTSVTITCSALDDFEETELEGTIEGEEEDSYTYPESYPTTNDYSIGSVVFYSSDSENEGFYSVSADDYTSTYAEYTGLTAIGVVAVPSSITQDNTVRIVALKYGSYTTPDEGSTEGETMLWGYDRNQTIGESVTTTTGATWDYTYYKQSFANEDENTVVGSTSAYSSSDGSSYKDSYYSITCLPRYSYETWTYGSSIQTDWTYCNEYGSNSTTVASGESHPWVPAPFTSSGEVNTHYLYDGSAAADLDGRDESNLVLTFLDSYTGTDDYSFTEDYETAESLTNSRAEGYYPSITCCYRYSTDGTNNGDWYLPAAGELAFLSLYFTQINDGITAAIGDDSSAGAVMGSSDAYWSSTEYKYCNVWVVDCSEGFFYGYNGNSNKKTTGKNYVRPFLTLSTSTNTVVNDSGDSTEE